MRAAVELRHEGQHDSRPQAADEQQQASYGQGGEGGHGSDKELRDASQMSAIDIEVNNTSLSLSQTSDRIPVRQ